jgi:hypothetical protein
MHFAYLRLVREENGGAGEAAAVYKWYSNLLCIA